MTKPSRPIVALLLSSSIAAACATDRPRDAATTPAAAAPAASTPLRDAREVHLGAVRQLTRGVGENAEAYWSFDGKELIFQSKRPPYACDQIFTVPADGSAPAALVSTGKGQTTCAYFTPAGDRFLYASTHEAAAACPAPPDHSQGYVWKLHEFDIYSDKRGGGDLRKLTGGPGYDAEATVCGKDGSIVFTSTRDGDLELYRMAADGSNVQRLTQALGYDGGAFFSSDCRQLVWRASRPEADSAKDYLRLLGQHMVRPTELEIMVADLDGEGLKNVRQVTHLGAASFAPFLHPSGKRILFSSNHGDPQKREFDIWAIDTDGTDLERITYAAGFDGFPMFSPDGKWLAFGSNRNQAASGETDVYVAEWIDTPRVPLAAAGPTAASPTAASAADRFMADVAWLADDAREGRGVGTAGLTASADYLERRFRALGVAPAIGDGYRQPFEVVAGQTLGAGNRLELERRQIPATDFVPYSGSAIGEVRAATVAAGHGIVARELGVDDYKNVRAKGKIVVVRRHVPSGKKFADPAIEAQYSDLGYKAAEARRHGAVGLVVIDAPAAGGKDDGPPESSLPELVRPPMVDAGIPVVVAKASAAPIAVYKSVDAAIRVDLVRRPTQVANVVGVIRAGAPDKLPGALVVGAHYDHLGLGDKSSLEPSKHAPHNGADDNASGVAGVLEIARVLSGRRAELRRDVYLVGFAAEEIGVLGSDHFVAHPPAGLAVADIVAMINLDMIGRQGDRPLVVQGGETAAEWSTLVAEACAAARVRCAVGGGGLGPSDHKPFYSAGRPVLYFFTGVHADYHKTSDDADKINAGGGAAIAGLAASIAVTLSRREGALTFRRTVQEMPPQVAGDRRARGGSLGLVPSYSDAKPGVLLDDVVPGGAAEQAGLERGDRVVEVGGTAVRDAAELMTVLRSAHPGQKTTLVFERDGKRRSAAAVFGKPRR
jgi:Tol biopolymer transport system component